MSERARQIGMLFAIAIAAAAAYFFAFLSDNLGWLSLAALTLLFGYWVNKKPLWCFLSGFIFLFFFLSVSLYWIYGYFGSSSGYSPALSAACGFAIMLVLSFLPFAITGLIWSTYRLKKHDYLTFLLLLPASYLFACMLQHLAINTIPWYFVGNALIDTPLAGWGPIVGVYGMSWLAVCTVGGILLLWQRRQQWLKTACVVVPIWLVIWLGGWFLTHIDWTKPTGKPVNLLLVQGNFQGRRGTKKAVRRLEHRKKELIYQQLVKKHATPNTVIILPENYIPGINTHERFGPATNVRWLTENNITLLLGSYTAKSFGKRSNALFALNGKQEQIYYKSSLIAFGEYNPFDKIRGKTSKTIAGKKNDTPFMIKGQAISPMICYESTLPSSSFYKKDSATWLATITNGVWYGRSWTDHHVYLFSQMRSLETGKPMAYVSNSGYTAVIDYQGHTQDIIPPYQNSVLKATISPRKGLTPYLRMGYWPLFIVNLVILAALITLYYIDRKR